MAQFTLIDTHESQGHGFINVVEANDHQEAVKILTAETEGRVVETNTRLDPTPMPCHVRMVGGFVVVRH